MGRQGRQISTEDLEKKHLDMYAEACRMADTVKVKPSKPRTCGNQTHRENPDVNAEEDAIAAYYRVVITIPLLDYLLVEFASRFSVLKRQAVNGFLILPALAAQTLPSITSFEFFEEDLPCPRSLQQELELWQMYWLERTEAERPKTALGALKACERVQFPNIFTILHILVVFPVTSSEAERSFSCIKRLKTRLRSTMGEERLNGLAMMLIHRDVDVSVTQVVRAFAAAHPRKMRLSFVLDDPRDNL